MDEGTFLSLSFFLSFNDSFSGKVDAIYVVRQRQIFLFYFLEQIKGKHLTSIVIVQLPNISNLFPQSFVFQDCFFDVQYVKERKKKFTIKTFSEYQEKKCSDRPRTTGTYFCSIKFFYATEMCVMTSVITNDC